MFWTIGQFPELDHLDAQQRRAVLAQIPWWTYPVMVSRAILLGTLLGVVGTVVVSLWARSRIVGVGLVPVGVLVAVGDYLLRLRRTRMAMRAEIVAGFRDQRPPFCFECGYDLRGSDAGRCPECGWTIPHGAAARAVPVADIGGNAVLIGELGRPIGEAVTIQGRRVENGARGGSFLVEMVEGQRVDPRATVTIPGIVDWPEGTPMTLRGCEVAMIGSGHVDKEDPARPAGLRPRQRILLTFEVLEIIEPKGLAVRRE